MVSMYQNIDKVEFYRCANGWLLIMPFHQTGPPSEIQQQAELYGKLFEKFKPKDDELERIYQQNNVEVEEPKDLSPEAVLKVPHYFVFKELRQLLEFLSNEIEG